MFSRVATVFTFLFFVLPLLAAATAVPRTDPTSGGGGSSTDQCNSGAAQCCKELTTILMNRVNPLLPSPGNSVQSSDSSLVGVLAGLLGIVLGPVESQVGVNCSPIVSGNSW